MPEEGTEKKSRALQNLQAREPAFNPVPVRFQGLMALHSGVSHLLPCSLLPHFYSSFFLSVAGFIFPCLVRIHGGRPVHVTCMRRRHGSLTVPAPVRHAC
jgi:hypothetical protein